MNVYMVLGPEMDWSCHLMTAPPVWQKMNKYIILKSLKSEFRDQLTFSCIKTSSVAQVFF